MPWDRPTDFTQPTDTVSAEEAAWDKPTTNDWFEPEPVDDRTPDMFDAYANPAERPTPPLTPTWAPVEPSTAPTSVVAAPPKPEPAADPYDAFAPVLGDVSAPFARQWPESNGHDAGRNAPMLSAAPAIEAEPELVADEWFAPQAEMAQAETAQAEWPQAEWEHAEWPQPGRVEVAASVQPAAVEPQTLEGTGLGPTPSADLFEWAPEPVLEAEPRFEPARAEAPVQPQPWHEEMAPDEIAPDEIAPDQMAFDEMERSDGEVAPEEVASPDVEVTPRVTVAQLALPYSTTAPGAPTNLVVRIELAIVDDGRRLVTVTPEREATTPTTPRHPEFDPRAPRAPRAPEPESAEAWIEPSAVPQPTGSAPWDEAPSTPLATEPAPWAAPAAAPWAAPAAPEPEPAAPTPEPVAWAPAAISPASEFFAPPEWNVPHDPETPAPWAPTPAAPPQAHQSASFAPTTFEPASYASQQPAAAMPMTADSRPSAAAAVASDNDLWFLSTEPTEAEVAAAPAATKEPSSALTGFLTIGMAVLVIVLVLVFIQLMTSLLR